jgi:hypothetical protein
MQPSESGGKGNIEPRKIRANWLYIFGLQKYPSSCHAADMASDAKPKKNPAAVALGRLGGLKGGAARAKTLTAAERKASARKAALARWSKKRKKA